MGCFEEKTQPHFNPEFKVYLIRLEKLKTNLSKI